MAASGYSPISLYYSTTASATPTNTNLVNGELALNITDGKLFYKDNAGTVQTLATKAATSGSFSTTTISTSETLSYGTANGVAYLNGSKVVTTGSALTFDGTNFAASNQIIAGIGVANANFIARSNVTNGGAGFSQYLFGNASGDTRGFLSYSHAAEAILFGTSSAEQMRLTSTGLGIGTSSPATKLDVVGAIRAVTASTAANNLRVGNTGNSLFLGVDSSTGGSNIVGSVAYATTLATNTALQISTNNGASVQATLDTSGNLGIGTSSPAVKLDVSGVIRSSSSLMLGTATDGSTGQFANSGGNGYLDYPGSLFFRSAASSTRLTLDSSGNLGLGVTPSAWISSGKAIDIAGFGSVAQTSSGSLASTFNAYQNSAGNWIYKTTNAAAQYQCGLAGLGQHAWLTAPSGTAGNAITFTQAMTLDASGNLGLGTTSPTVNLHVYNASSAEIRTASANIGLQLYSSEGAGTSVIGTYTNHALVFRTNATERARIDSSGNLLIGTTSSDGSRLRVYGSYQTLGDGSYEGLIGKASSLVSGGGAGEFAIRSSSNLLFATNGNTERARIDSSGNLLVGTTNSDNTVNTGSRLYSNGSFGTTRSGTDNTTNTLVVYSTGASANRFYVGMAGTVYATSTTITAISDQRLKENIQDIDVGLDAVMALKPRKFDWKAGKGKNKKGDRGWIAQEFEQVFPDMIDTWADPAPEGEEPYKAVNADLIPVLVKAIQEQQALITQLTERITALESK